MEISNETIRRWVLKFGQAVGRNLRRVRPIAHSQWHLDEMVVSIAGRRMYMWRAVDSEGEVLEVLVQPRRDKAAAVRLIKKRLKRHGLLHSSRREIHRTASAFHAGEAYLFGNSERLG